MTVCAKFLDFLSPVISMKTRLSHLIIALSACMFLSCDANQQPNPGDFSARSLPIINGTPVSGDDHLATVAMVLNYTTGADAFCTGTLITPNYVLTAAHCISQCQGDSTNIEEFRPHMSVAIGQSEATFRKIIPIKAFHPHPKFYCSPYRISNDIAIVQLAEPVHLAEVTPILPIPPVFDMTADEIDNTGVDVVTVGFGLTDPNNNASSGKKYMTEQRVYAYCPISGEQSRLCGTQLTDTDGFIYFNATNTGTSQGDSGGPTFMKRDGVYYVVGVTSYGYEECRYVTAMTLVSEHFDFIAGIVKDLSADSPENCTNQIDDNGDGRIDCKDPYCFHIKQCVPEECVNQKDDNEDGFTDCEDPQCASELLCQPENCTNKVDDNGNGLIDCNDLQCFGTLICTPENCANGIDDNGNGLTDCEETETCSKSLNCIPENCSNRKDDNGNMLIDCDDPQCETALVCLPEICNDNVDNNGNSKIDCQDPQCTQDIHCQPENCSNGVDDNANGLADCQDSACTAEKRCQPEICDNQIDDNDNGHADCDDPECADICASTSSSCTSAPLTSGSHSWIWLTELLGLSAGRTLRRRRTC